MSNDEGFIRSIIKDITLNNPLIKYVRKDIPYQFNEVRLLTDYWSRVESYYNNNLLPPYEILIQTSSVCNLKCLWCIGKNAYRQSRCNKLPQMLMDEHNMNKLVNNINGYCKIIKRIKNEKIIEEIVNIENISFSGFTGEPLIAKKATLLGMKCFTENGKRVGMFTNGTLMNQDTWGVIINIAYVLISIDAGTPKTYSIMKCAGSKIGEDLFYKVINNINLLASRKENLRSKLDINVGFVINQYNYKELYDIAKICKDIGVHYFRIKTDIALNHMLNKEEILKTRECVDKVKYILQDNTFKIVEIHKVDKKRTNIRKFHKCFMHALMGAIGPNGNVYPCNYHSKVNGLHYGNIFMESFREIWENKLNNNLCHNIPNECPITCDPFKMRGNELLSETYKIYNNGNGSFVNYLDDLSKYIFANNYV